MLSTLFRLSSLALVLSLTGCATLENAADHTRDFAKRHPVVTGVATAVVVGGVVYALDRHHNDSTAHLQRGLPCDGRGETECRP